MIVRDDAVSFRFTGRAGEYFRIWIVNICLSVLTLGIYSAWAKVRRKRYFYGNTLLNDAAFEYLADPKAILKGRLIVLVIWAGFSMAQNHGLPGVVVGLLFLVFVPEVVIRAARFNAVSSAHRNVRFHFGVGFQPKKSARTIWSVGYRETSQFLILPIILVPLTLGLLYPYYAFRKRQFLLSHMAYGTTPFSFDARPGAFYSVYLKAVLLFVIVIAGSIVTVGVALLPLYILFAAYRDAAVGRLAWSHTGLGTLRFGCTWTTWDLFKLYFVNSLAIIFSVGLLAPWAAIRAARYNLQGLSLGPARELNAFIAAEQAQPGAFADEAADLFGLDFGL